MYYTRYTLAVQLVLSIACTHFSVSFAGNASQADFKQLHENIQQLSAALGSLKQDTTRYRRSLYAGLCYSALLTCAPLLFPPAVPTKRSITLNDIDREFLSPFLQYARPMARPILYTLGALGCFYFTWRLLAGMNTRISTLEQSQVAIAGAAQDLHVQYTQMNTVLTQLRTAFKDVKGDDKMKSEIIGLQEYVKRLRESLGILENSLGKPPQHPRGGSFGDHLKNIADRASLLESHNKQHHTRLNTCEQLLRPYQTGHREMSALSIVTEQCPHHEEESKISSTPKHPTSLGRSKSDSNCRKKNRQSTASAASLLRSPPPTRSLRSPVSRSSSGGGHEPWLTKSNEK